MDNALHESLTYPDPKIVLRRLGDQLTPILDDKNLDGYGAIERLHSALGTTYNALESADSRNTSITLLKDLNHVFGQIEELLRVYRREALNIARIAELTDRVFEKMPLINPLKTRSDLSSQEDEANRSLLNLKQKMDSLAEDAKQRFDNFVSEASGKVGLVEQNLEKSNQMVHFISGRALGGHFSERAQSEKAIAESWTKWTWGFAIGTVVFVFLSLAFHVFFYYKFPERELDWKLFGAKALVLVTLGFITKWLSRRASRHLAEESNYHRLAVNMNTVDGFIASLNPPIKDHVLAEIAIKTFTDASGNDHPSEYETIINSDTVKAIAERIKP